MGPKLFYSIQKELSPNRLLPSLTVGLTTGTLGVLFDSSFAALIFSGSLSDYLSAGIGLVLISAAVSRIMVALMSSFGAMVADLSTVPTAILAWSAGMVLNQMPSTASETEILITVITTIALTSLLTGVFLFGMGALQLGNLVRLLPEPVIGGFIASTGWLLIKGAFKVMTSQPFGLSSFALLSQPKTFVQWLPGLLLAIYLLIAGRRRVHPLLTSSSLFVAIALFYLCLPLMGSSANQVINQGLTLGVPEFQTPWQLLSWQDLSQVHWSALLSQWMCSATIIITTAIALMMNVKGMAMVAERDINTNHELKVAGVVNILLGCGGGILSFHSLNKSVLAYKMGGRSRLSTLIGAAMFVLLPILGTPLLNYFPKPILGGLLLYLGLSLMVQWVYQAWHKLPRLHYSIVQAIWIVSGLCGFLQGLALGWGLAVVLFIFNGTRMGKVRSDA
ncbi:MAG: SulP family inorganic anion transporter [Cyanophyceae cyanobacterium]